MHGAPDIVFEILSPSTANYDLSVKKESYEKYGVREYWIVDPIERSIELFVSVNGKFESRFVGSEGDVNSTLLPGFSIKAEEVFPRVSF